MATSLVVTSVFTGSTKGAVATAPFSKKVAHNVRCLSFSRLLAGSYLPPPSGGGSRSPIIQLQRASARFPPPPSGIFRVILHVHTVFFKGSVHRALVVVFPLGFHIFQNRREIPLGKTDRAITPLPFNGTSSKLLVHVMRSGAFDFSHPIGQKDKGLDLDQEMQVVLNAADPMALHALGFTAIVFDVVVDGFLKMGSYESPVIFAVPVQVDEYFGEHMAGDGEHG